MIGLGTKENSGSVCLTDMDVIQRSNINNQFLFRTKNIGNHKSITAKTAVQRMNPSLNIFTQQNCVGPDSEQEYDEIFFEKLDGVGTAVDNVETRLYVDRKCVYNRKPLIDSGIYG